MLGQADRSRRADRLGAHPHARRPRARSMPNRLQPCARPRTTHHTLRGSFLTQGLQRAVHANPTPATAADRPQNPSPGRPPPPARTPVKAPGPRPTAMASSRSRSRPDSQSSCATMLRMASPEPRGRALSLVSEAPSIHNAAEHSSVAVSSASSFTPAQSAARCPRGRRRARAAAPAQALARARAPSAAGWRETPRRNCAQSGADRRSPTTPRSCSLRISPTDTLLEGEHRPRVAG